MRKEIEVKARVTDLDKIIQKLTEKGCVLSEPIEQRDFIFIKPEVSYENMKFGDIFLRVRVTPAANFFTLKQQQKNELDCIEEETEILNPDTMKEALKVMGYIEAVKVSKIRQKTICEGLEICLDKVEELGNFIEVEKITDDEDGKKVQEELLEFLPQFGISREDRVTQGYDTMIYFKSKIKT